MSAGSDVKQDFIQPIAILTIICLVCAAMLAYLNGVTKPIIQATEARIAEEARSEVLPDAGGFELLDVTLPEGSFVTEVYKAANGSGYVFMVTGNGYGGKGTMKLITSVDNEGKIIATQTLQHSETAGMGSKTADEAFRSQFPGVSAQTLDTDVDAVTGATISSNHYFNSMRSVFEAYDAVKEAGL